MALLLADHILAALNLTSADPLSDLEDAIRALPTALSEIVCSDDGRDTLLRLAQAADSAEIEIFSSVSSVPAWCYHEIQLDGISVGEILEVPTGSNRTPPSNAEIAGLRAWNKHETMVDENQNPYRFRGDQIVAIWQRGNLVTPTVRRSLVSLFGATLRIGSLASRSNWQDAEIANLKSESYKKLENNLVLVAFSEREVRWKFLNLYRVLENGYLSSILSTLNVSFGDAPKQALAAAQKALESEVNQMISLVRAFDLGIFFEEMKDTLDHLDGNNQFATALIRDLRSDERLRQLTTKTDQGVLACYKIRCSIVHAGDSYLIYERFPDADAALGDLIEILESAVLSYLGLQLTV